MDSSSRSCLAKKAKSGSKKKSKRSSDHISHLSRISLTGQRQLEANARKEAEREAAQAGYQFKIEQMMTQMEAQMRRSTQDETVRCQNELKEQRIQTLEKARIEHRMPWRGEGRGESSHFVCSHTPFV